MPRWASRITLEVTAVRLEQLQEISDEDAQDEGASPIDEETGTIPYSKPYRKGFRQLWMMIHGGLAWESNPEVVVISFKRIPQP